MGFGVTVRYFLFAGVEEGFAAAEFDMGFGKMIFKNAGEVFQAVLFIGHEVKLISPPEGKAG